MDFLTNKLPDKCANLIIGDPPYFRVRGEFDFAWETFEHYLTDVEKWAIECKRLLSDNGTLFWYGASKNIAYSQIILDKHFNLLNNLVWNKGAFMGLEKSEGLRSFAPCTERILMYSSKFNSPTGLETVKLDINNFKTLRDYFRAIQEFTGETKSTIIKKVGQQADHCFRWGSAQWDLPTRKTYNSLIAFFNIDRYEGFKEYEELRKEYEELRKEYEELRKEYEELRRPFNNSFNLQEVLNFKNESTKTGAKYDHDTVKPESLTRALILTCSRKDDLVLVPFAGSGTECAMAAKENRRFIGFDVSKKYTEMANKRCKPFLIQPQLF